MGSVTDLINLRRRVEAAQAEKERAAGALNQIMARLKRDFNCSTIDDAQAMLASLQKKVAEQEKQFQEALCRFRNDFGNFLGLPNELDANGDESAKHQANRESENG